MSGITPDLKPLPCRCGAEIARAEGHIYDRCQACGAKWSIEDLRSLHIKRTQPAAPVAEDATKALASALMAVCGYQRGQDMKDAKFLQDALMQHGFTIAPVAKPVADETAARCGESQPGSKSDDGIPGAAVLDEKLREAVGFLKWLRPIGPEAQRVGSTGAITYDLTLSTIEAALAELAELREGMKQAYWLINSSELELSNAKTERSEFLRGFNAITAKLFPNGLPLPTPPAAGGV